MGGVGVGVGVTVGVSVAVGVEVGVGVGVTGAQAPLKQPAGQIKDIDWMVLPEQKNSIRMLLEKQ